MSDGSPVETPRLRLEVQPGASEAALILDDGVPFPMDAAKLDSMIQALVQVRAAIPPARPNEPPTSELRFMHAMRWHVLPDTAHPGTVVLALLHVQFGWIGMHIGQDDAMRLTQVIAAVARPAGGPRPN